MRITGSFNGTGADVTLCIGFIPDYVTLWNLQGTQILKLEWNKEMLRAVEVVEGIQIVGSSSTVTALTKGNGIILYHGGTKLAAADVGTTTYGHADAVYLKPDHRDYRYTTADSPHGVGDAAESTIDTWTLDSSSTYAGNFGAAGATSGTYIGVGSPICIDGKWYVINTFSADGGDASDVILNLPAPSGEIQYIGGMYGTIPMKANEITMDGFLISNTTINVTDEQVMFEAGQYDR